MRIRGRRRWHPSDAVFVFVVVAEVILCVWGLVAVHDGLLRLDLSMGQQAERTAHSDDPTREGGGACPLADGESE